MRITDKQVEEIIQSLQGSCQTLDHVIRSVTEDDALSDEDLTEDQLSIIDNEIFLCAECGWWCEQSESTEAESGENICQDCVDLREDESDE